MAGWMIGTRRWILENVYSMRVYIGCILFVHKELIKLSSEGHLRSSPLVGVPPQSRPVPVPRRLLKLAL